MRFSAFYILLINKDIWIPACAGMTGLGHFRIHCFHSVREQEKMDYMRFSA